MHSSLFLVFGLTVSCSAQFADLTIQSEEDPSTSTVAPQITSTNNAEIAFDTTNDGAMAADSGTDSPEALIISQTDDKQRCFFNNDNQMPPQRRLRLRQSCRNNQYVPSPGNPPATDTEPPATTLQEGEPQEGSGADGYPNRPSGEQNRIGTPRTSKPPELPSIPGRTPERDPDPCKEERTYAVCSPLEPTTVWFPLSLVWSAGSLEYCRLCTFFYHLHSPFFLRRTQPEVFSEFHLYNF